MKKNYLRLSGSFLLVSLVFAGCQKTGKEFNEQIAQESKGGNDNNHDKCQLIGYAQSDGYAEAYQYNHKGLVDKMSLDYGGGYVEEYDIKYDHKNRIKSSRFTAPLYLPGDAVNYTFYNDGKLTTRVTVHLESSGDLWSDIYYTYNRKGQMIKQDERVNDQHSRFYYDEKGFNTRTEYYLGSELFYKFLNKYDIPNRNPFLALKGVDFWFMSLFSPLWDKRFNSSATYIYYDNGNPVVFLEDDPAQTIHQAGSNNYLTRAQYYDNIAAAVL